MWKFWNYHGPVWAPENEGGGGGGEGEGDGGNAGAPAGDNAGGDAPGADAGKSQPSTIFDALADAQAKADAGETKPGEKPADPPAGEWKAPDGIPDHLKGKTAEETLQKTLKAYSGARAELSKRPAMAGTVPETPEGYEIKAVGENDPIAAEWSNPDSKPFVEAFQKAAHELKIPAEVFQDLMRKGLEGVGDLGIPIGKSEDELLEISATKEMEDLVSKVGTKEALTLLNTVDTYAKKLTDSGLLTKEEQAEFRVMVGTAESARVFYKIMTGEFGERPIPPADGGTGDVSQADAYAMHAKASALPAGAEKDAALAAANAAITRAVGTQPAGAIRSNVL